MTTYEKAYEKLEKYGQLHVLQYYAELSEEQKEELLAQILATDFSVLTSREKETEKISRQISSLPRFMGRADS